MTNDTYFGGKKQPTQQEQTYFGGETQPSLQELTSYKTGTPSPIPEQPIIKPELSNVIKGEPQHKK